MSPITSGLGAADPTTAVDAENPTAGHVAPPETVRIGTRVALRVVRAAR